MRMRRQALHSVDRTLVTPPATPTYSRGDMCTLSLVLPVRFTVWAANDTAVVAIIIIIAVEVLN